MGSHTTQKWDDQDRWIIQVRQNLTQEQENITKEVEEVEEDEFPICIFGVPNSLMVDSPEAFIPQQVAIGPYHRWRHELSHMEGNKLLAAKRSQKKLLNLPFQEVVSHFMKLDSKVRGCYHRHLDLNADILAWMMAVDASFLLEFLQIFATHENNLTEAASSQMVDFQTSWNSKIIVFKSVIVRDIIMLENQIPLFILFEFFAPSLFNRRQNWDGILASMLMGLCKSLTPFKRAVQSLEIDEDELLKRGHLLDLLYFICVPNRKDETVRSPEEENLKEDPGLCRKFFAYMFSSCNLRLALVSKKLKKVVKIPVRMIGMFGFLSSPRKTSDEPSLPMERSMESKGSSRKGSSTATDETPLQVEELLVPKASQLSKAGVQFRPTSGDLTSIKFDKKLGILLLPVITLDENSEVVLKNMVAYEAGATSGPLLLTRYTEFMNGIIDTEADARILKKAGIIFNHLKSEKEVAKLWNGMSKSVKLTKVGCIDKVVEELGSYYNGRWRVRGGKFVKKYVFGCWPLLTLMAANLLIVTTTLQAFCSIYNCKGTAILGFHVGSNSTLG